MNPEVQKGGNQLPGGEFGRSGDLKLVRAGVEEFFDGSDRNPAHSERVIDIMRDFGHDTVGLEMTALLHDVIDHGIVNPQDEKQHEQAEEFIVGLYEKVEDKNMFVYAVGCSISASNWESEVAEVWRASALKEASEYRGEHDDVDSAILMGAISKNSAIMDSYPSDMVESVLKSTRLFDLDTEKLRSAMTKLDVEGLIVKAAELMDNLDHPPPDNPASTWRDCTEIFNCYGPALDLFGFKTIASELRGKALEFFYEDPGGKAARQRELSEKYFGDVDEQIRTGIELSGRQEDGISTVPLRIKSQGSIRQKLHDKNYWDVDMVPDGLASTVLIPDEMTDEQIKSLAYDIRLGIMMGAEGQVEARHTRGDTPFEIRKKEKTGYSAIHLTFMYQTPDGPVPYELQFVTHSQHFEHEVGKPSHMLFKAGITEPYEHVIRDMQHIYARAHHLRSQVLKPELNPNTWAQILKFLPNMDTPLHQAFTYNGSAEGKTVLLPPELSSIDLSEFAESIDADSELDAVFLPPNKLEVDRFFELIGLIDPSLGSDRRIKEAVELLQSLPLKPRKDGEPTLEGHLLPTALNAAILAATSGEHWEDKEDPTEYLSKTITSAMLHDVIEDMRKHKRKITKDEVSSRFGDDVGETVDSLTTYDEDEMELEHVRRVAYAKKIAKNPRALLIKLSDRMQNHQTDLVSLRKGVDKEVEKSIFDYFVKTDIYLSEYFAQLPAEYKRVKDMIWAMAEHFGYRPIETNT